ncbi:MAG TPA: ATP-binding protein [Spirochaetia bacterium]|nr:ATP-binding protein [Spirochaetia bacterium]
MIFLPSLLLLVGMVAASWVVIHQTGALGEQLNGRVAEVLAAQIDRKLGARVQVLDRLATTLEALPAPSRQERFVRIASRQTSFSELALLDPARVVQFAWPEPVVGPNFSFLDRVPPGSELFWGEASLTSGAFPAVPVARIFDGGILVGWIDLGPVSREVALVSQDSRVSVSIIDKGAVYLANPDQMQVRSRGTDQSYLAHRSATGVPASLYVESREGGAVLVSVRPLSEGWSLLVAQPLAQIYQPLVPVFFLLTPLVFLFALGALFMVRLMDRHLLGALTVLRQETEGLGRGDSEGAEPVRTRYQDLNSILDAFQDVRRSVRLREQDLKVSERRFRRMFEDAAVGIFHTSYSGALLDLNQAMAALLGYPSPEEAKLALGDTSQGLFVRPEERGAVLRMLQESPDAKIQVTTEFFHRTGTILTVNHHLARVFDHRRGEFILESFAEDVTDLKKAEAEIRELNAALEMKVQERTQHLERALDDLGRAQTHLVQSEKMAALGQMIAGIAHELNTPLGAIHASNESIALLLQKVLQGLPEIPQELAGLQRRFYESSIRDLAVVPSVTLRKRRREIQSALADRSLDAGEEILDFLVELGVTTGWEEWEPLLTHPQGPATIRLTYEMVCLERSSLVIASASDKAAKVIHALRTFSHQAQETTFERVSVRLGLETVLTLFQNRLKGGVVVRTEFDDRARVWGLEDKLNQVWTNLIANALAAMGDRGSLEILVTMAEGLVRVAVVDNGPGVDPGIRSRIFEPFFTTKKTGEGSGLGLDICRKIVEEHHGKIDFESCPGRTEFYVELPEAR